MKHCAHGRKFNRKKDQRKALFKIMAADLILKEKIRTTEAKAKELRPFVEKLITKGRLASKTPGKKLAVTRYLSSLLHEKARKKVMSELGVRYLKRAGGYTRIIKLVPRKSDGAKMAVIELVDRPSEAVADKKAVASKAGAGK